MYTIYVIFVYSLFLSYTHHPPLYILYITIFHISFFFHICCSRVYECVRVYVWVCVRVRVWFVLGWGSGVLTAADQASLHVRSTHVLLFPGPFYYIFLPPVIPYFRYRCRRRCFSSGPSQLSPPDVVLFFCTPFVLGRGLR